MMMRFTWRWADDDCRTPRHNVKEDFLLRRAWSGGYGGPIRQACRHSRLYISRISKLSPQKSTCFDPLFLLLLIDVRDELSKGKLRSIEHALNEVPVCHLQAVCGKLEAGGLSSWQRV